MANLLLAIQKHKCVKEMEVIEFIEERDLYYFKIKTILQDNSILYIREVVTPLEDKYSYHWVSPEEKFLLRWDNAPHWREIETYPHHLHQGSEEEVGPSSKVAIIDVLDWIMDQISGLK